MKYQQMKATYVEGAPQLKAIQQKLDALTAKLNQAKEAARKEIMANPRAPQGAGGGVGALEGGGMAAPTAVPSGSARRSRTRRRRLICR